MTLFQIYRSNRPTVQACSRFRHRNAEGRAKGSRAISIELFSADDQIQMKGTRKTSRKMISSAYCRLLPPNRFSHCLCDPGNSWTVFGAPPTTGVLIIDQDSPRSRRRMKMIEATSVIAVMTSDRADAYPTRFWVNASL